MCLIIELQESVQNNLVSPYAFGYSVNDGVGNRQFHDEFGNEKGDKIGSYGYTDTSGMYRKVNYVADENGFNVKVQSNEMPPAPGVKEKAISVKIKPVISPIASSSSIRGYNQYEPVESESNEDEIHIYESRRGQIKPFDDRNENLPSRSSNYLNGYPEYSRINHATTKKPGSHGSALFGSYYKSLRDKSHENDQANDNEKGKEEFESDFNMKFKRVPKYQMPNDGQSQHNNLNTIIISSNSPYIMEGLRKANNYVEDPSVKPYLPRAIKMVKLKSYKKVDPRDLSSNYSQTQMVKPRFTTPTPSPRYYQSQYHQQQLRHQALKNTQQANYGMSIDHGHQQIKHDVIKVYPKPGTSPYFDNADWMRSLTTTTPAPKIESHFTWYRPQVPATNAAANTPIVRRPSAPAYSIVPTPIVTTTTTDYDPKYLSDYPLFEKRSKVTPKENLNTIESSNEIIQNEIENKYYGHVPFGARLSAMGKNISTESGNKQKSDDLKRFYHHYESTRNVPIERVPDLDLNRTRSKEDEIIHVTYQKMIPKVHYDLEREVMFNDLNDNSVIDDRGDSNVISKRIDEGVENDQTESTSTTSAPPKEMKKFSYEPYEPPITSKDTILDKWSARIWPPPSKKT